ncbi:C4-dicarboxylate ABC transporter [Streptacidiphilus sp. EB129]|uniref:SLAC1 family transporter n=1 Tax=Streptacidiphilus sp. EB129 TaxID=3156262 RepID=UPI003517452A
MATTLTPHAPATTPADAPTAVADPAVADPADARATAQPDARPAGQDTGQPAGQPAAFAAAGRFGPNWYAAVMGTAIVANGAHALPLVARTPVLSDLAAGVWLLSLLMLATLVATRLYARRLPDRLRAMEQPSTAVFFGCPPMAMMAVGAGALGAGAPLLPAGFAVGLDAVLWTVGTGYGLVVAAWVMYLLVARFRVDRAGSAPTWLLPVVAPMVSAALGPALLPHLPAGQPRATMLVLCLALLGASLLSVLVLLPGVWARLVHEEPLPAVLVPTLFLVLGPLGQSVTAMSQFAGQAATVSPALATPLQHAALLYGIPVIGFALLWFALATAVTVRRLRDGMPFAMTWWAFTFPVGTCVTGAAGLARMTGLAVFDLLSGTLFLVLLLAWSVATTRTVRGLAAGRL